MSSNRGGGNGQYNKGKSVDVNQLNRAVQHVNLGPGTAAASTRPNPWGQPGGQRTSTRVNAPVRAPNNAWAARTSAVPPPLQGGWNWNARVQNNNIIPNPQPIVEDDDNEIDESDDEILSDEYDSDETPQTHEQRKKNRWYVDFFETLDTLTLEEINEATRQWHCPACKNGPGAIDWYKSLLSLITHAKTKGSKRVKIHRGLAEILEEELRNRGAAINPAGESYGQWKGLNEVVKDKEIVWPPMVVIMNTQLEQDDNNKWIGMGNQELLDYFESYAAVRARHSYGPRGHMGMSMLIFESSAVGYTEADRLSKHFEDEGTDRDKWDRRPILFYPGGKRKLYGYMATKDDMDIFNKHSHGKSKLKFEMVSHQEKVVNQLKKMNEDNQQLQWYKNKVTTEKMHSKAVEESNELLSQRLRDREAQYRIVRERTQQHHEQTKEEMDNQEEFFKDQMKVIEDARNAKEGRFDQMKQEERMTVDPLKRDLKLEEMKEFEEEREKLMKEREEKIGEMKSRYWKEQLEIEADYDAKATQLMNKYIPKP